MFTYKYSKGLSAREKTVSTPPSVELEKEKIKAKAEKKKAKTEAKIKKKANK